MQPAESMFGVASDIGLDVKIPSSSKCCIMGKILRRMYYLIHLLEVKVQIQFHDSKTKFTYQCSQWWSRK